MISDATIAGLESKHPRLKYILGARLRSDHEVRRAAGKVLQAAGVALGPSLRFLDER